MKVLTIIPTYNEAGNIARLVDEIVTDVLVVDDDSPDGTGDIVRKLNERGDAVVLMNRYNERGYGSATIEGFRYALRHWYDVVVTIDGDFSLDPADIQKLLAALDNADVAIGSRYVGGIRVLNWDLRRLLLSMGASAYLRLLTGMKFKDCTCGFRAYRTSVFENVLLGGIKSEGYAFLPELLFALRRYRIVEVPITFTERRLGESKMSRRMMIEGVLRPWAMLWRSVCVE